MKQVHKKSKMHCVRKDRDREKEKIEILTVEINLNKWKNNGCVKKNK